MEYRRINITNCMKSSTRGQRSAASLRRKHYLQRFVREAAPRLQLHPPISCVAAILVRPKHNVSIALMKTRVSDLLDTSVIRHEIVVCHLVKILPDVRKCCVRFEYKKRIVGLGEDIYEEVKASSLERNCVFVECKRSCVTEETVIMLQVPRTVAWKSLPLAGVTEGFPICTPAVR